MTVAPSRRKSSFPMALFVVLLFCVPIAWIAYSAAHGHKLFPSPLPPGTAQPTR